MQKKKTGGWGETLRTVVWAVGIALVVRTFAFEPFNIPSGSMVPTLLVGDYLFVSKYSYGYSRYSLPFGLPLIPGRVLFSEPERGDVAVFKLPADPSTDFIKRIIGLPGDRIQVKEGRLYVNGTLVDRQRIGDYDYVKRNGQRFQAAQYLETLPGGKTYRILEVLGDRGVADNTPEFVVPPGHYFMMGDNRDDSTDSRLFRDPYRFVPRENLVGRAEFLFYSKDSNRPIWALDSIRFDRLFGGIE